MGIRDPEKWYESAVNTIWHPWGFEWSPFMTISPTIRDLHKLRNSYISRVLKVPYDELNPRDVWNKEKMIKGFNQHIEDVKATIPADKLHIFRVCSSVIARYVTDTKHKTVSGLYCTIVSKIRSCKISLLKTR